MNVTFPKLSRLGRAVLAGCAVAAVACGRDELPISEPPTTTALAVGFDVSDVAAGPGSRIAVALRAEAQDPLAGLQGFLRFNPARLRYVGQAPAGATLTMLNDGAAGRGELRVLSLNVAGLEPRTAVLVFEVRAADYTRDLEYTLEEAVLRDERIIRTAIAGGAQLAPDLAVPAAARTLTLDDWNRFLAPKGEPGGPARTPGQYFLNLRYGDATLNGAITVSDVSYIANVAVGNQQIIVGTDAPARDAVVAGNVRPANLPGLGDPSDANPPGRESNGNRQITVSDAAAVANEAVGTNVDIAGELIPGRGPLPTTNTVLVADEVITDPVVGQLHVIRANRTLDNSTVWELPGIVSVREGAVLTIQPGTRVEGQVSPVKSALFIERDGRLIADGTPLQPIVFTCTAATKTRGCWGGIWVAGNAHVNEGGTGLPPSPAITGRAAGGCLQRQGEGGATTFGGCNDADSSGVFRYLVIEYGGFILQANNELNGLTMGGVGSGTVVDFVQVHGGLDDGIELFGGSVNLKHLYLTANSDDSYDLSFGWNGKTQFVIIQHDPNDADKGFEVDNTETAATFNNLPRTSGSIFNVTFVGASSGAGGNASNDAYHIRNGARLEMRNFLTLSARRGMDLDNVETCTNINVDQRTTHSLFAGVVALGNTDADPECAPYTVGAAETSLEQEFLEDAANNNTIVASAAGLVIAATNVMIPDFRAVSGSLAATLVGMTPPSDGFFDPTATYVGGVAPASATGGNIPWYSGWTRGWQSPTAP